MQENAFSGNDGITAVNLQQVRYFRINRPLVCRLAK
jgi:hypothetical protein